MYKCFLLFLFFFLFCTKKSKIQDLKACELSQCDLQGKGEAGQQRMGAKGTCGGQQAPIKTC